METGGWGIYSILMRWNKFAVPRFAWVRDEQAIADAATDMETPGATRQPEYAGL
jgi:hypothetical protein